MADSIAVFDPGYKHPEPGGTFEFYEAGTDTPKLVYADQGLTSSLGAIVYTDSLGYPVTAFGGSTRTLIYVGTALFKIVIKDADGVVIATHDNIPGAVVGSGASEEESGITQGQADARYTRNANALSALTDIAAADLIPFFDVSASNNKAIRFDEFSVDAANYLATLGRVFNAGDITVFYMSAAPVGWTTVTTTALNNAAIRLVTSGGGVTGGTADFSTVFAARTITQANLPSVNFFGGTDTHGGHAHIFSADTDGRATGAFGTVSGLRDEAAGSSDRTTQVGGAHNHAVSVASGGSGVAMDFAVKRADFRVCQKD